MYGIINFLINLKNAIKEYFSELTLCGKCLLGPLIVFIFILIAISTVFIGFPVINFQKKFYREIVKGTDNVQRIFYRAT